MRIDVHTHTKKVKQGDSVNRNVDVSKFSEIIKSIDVKILAITNHNHFDCEQYVQFKESVDGVCQVWPGIEFDILEEGRRAHLITIVNPNSLKAFSEKVRSVVGQTSPDVFTISIDDVVESFDNLDAIFIAHYHSKKPSLTDKDVDKLTSLVANPKRILKEAANSISAGIYINHGHNSIHGSDVQDWNEYVADSKSLPELRLPVESFEQFCLLLEKDVATINTILNKKTKESIQLSPFGVAELIDVDIYNDINIIFGSKGTGKTDILKALSAYYNSKGFKTEVYESNSNKLDSVFDLKGVHYDVNIEDLKIDDCILELFSLKNAEEKEVTSISKYVTYYSTEATNRISKNISVDKFTPDDIGAMKRSFDEIRSGLRIFLQFKDAVERDSKLRDIIGLELLNDLNDVVAKIIDKLNLESGQRFVSYKSIDFFNHLIKIFVKEISKKTGRPEKPIKTGFYEYASNRISIQRYVNKILANVSKSIDPRIEYVGDLGDKGKIFCKTNLILQNGRIVEAKYKHVQCSTKTAQKLVSAQIETISKYIYSNVLFEKIAELKAIDGSENVLSIKDLLMFYKYFTLDNDPYTPSNGESSMVLLHNELMKDKEIYLIDEPEKSLGNDYISEVIVPLIKERARAGKKIIIATHDANIAVRTLPYNSIYREHSINGYYTYSGNPFSNSLVCNVSGRPNLDWKLMSMKTLEGGKSAFGERGKIYGNV
jgi:energy-coupling factor transporter ATP-binding protein EcfA2